MDRLLARLERRFGRYAIENLTTVIVGGMIAVFFLSFVAKGFPALLELDLNAIAHGQVWRIFTFLFLPPTDSMLWFVFAVMITYQIGTSLESEWGAFKFNVYYTIGALGTIVAALITRESITNVFLNSTLFLAFATVFPRYEFRLFFFIPMQVRWLALLDVVFLAWQFAEGDWGARAGIIAGVSNYLFFFTGTLIALLRARKQDARTRARREELRGGPVDLSTDAIGQRSCAICGAREVDGADIRVCSCEKCQAAGGTRNLCLPHARAH